MLPLEAQNFTKFVLPSFNNSNLAKITAKVTNAFAIGDEDGLSSDDAYCDHNINEKCRDMETIYEDAKEVILSSIWLARLNPDDEEFSRAHKYFGILLLLWIWVYGNSFESFLLVVVVPEKKALEDWAAEDNETEDFEGLCKSSNVKKASWMR